jgi:hypothetical protein
MPNQPAQGIMRCFPLPLFPNQRFAREKKKKRKWTSGPQCITGPSGKKSFQSKAMENRNHRLSFLSLGPSDGKNPTPQTHAPHAIRKEDQNCTQTSKKTKQRRNRISFADSVNAKRSIKATKQQQQSNDNGVLTTLCDAKTLFAPPRNNPPGKRWSFSCFALSRDFRQTRRTRHGVRGPGIWMKLSRYILVTSTVEQEPRTRYRRLRKDGTLSLNGRGRLASTRLPSETKLPHCRGGWAPRRSWPPRYCWPAGCESCDSAVQRERMGVIPASGAAARSCASVGVAQPRRNTANRPH